MPKIPLMIISPETAKKITKPFIGLSYIVARLFSGLRYDLKQTDIDLDEGEYIAASLINSFLFFILFFALLFALSFKIQLKEVREALIISLASSLGIFILIMFVLVRYPKIIAGKKAEQIDKNLIFALKDMLLEISSGVSLYNALVNISKAGYGDISTELAKVAQAVNTGTSMEKALEKLAIESKSEYLRRTSWQLINTLKAGASLKGALKSIIDDLTIDQRAKIRDYAHELNLWSLVYMLFAVAIPTIGSTLLVILSSFAAVGLTKASFILFLVLCFIVQYILIGLIKARRPIVNI